MARIGQINTRRKFFTSGRKGAIVRACQPTLELLEDRRLLAGISVNFTGGGNGGRGLDAMAPGDIAGVVPLSNYNNMDTGNGGATLNDSTGAATTALLSYSAGGTYSAIGGTTGVPTPGDEKLNAGFIYGNGSVTVSGVPYAQYDIYVYELNDAGGRVETTSLSGGQTFYGSAATPNDANHIDQNAATPYVYTRSSSTVSSSPTPGGDYVLFSHVSGGSFTFTTSAPGNGYLNGFQIVEDLTAPGAPTNVVATPANNSVQLDWAVSPGATSYSVYRSTTSGAETLLQAGIGGNTFTDSTAVNNTLYFYQISASSTFGTSAKSSEVSVTPSNAPNNIVTTGSASKVTITWNAVAGATGYNVYRGAAATGPFTVIGPNVQGTSFDDTTAAPGTNYFYKLSTLTAPNPESALSPAVAGNRTIIGNGDGWSAKYFTNQTATGTPGYQRVDSSIDVSGGNDSIRPPGLPVTFNSANPVGPGNTFSVRWDGMVQAQYSEIYTLFPATDDGVRLTVDGVVQEDILTVGRGVAEDTLVVKDVSGNPVQWVAGSKHLVTMEFQQGGGGYDYHLRWSSNSTFKATIPQSQVQAIVPTAAPGNFTAVPNNATVILNWNSISVDTYNVLRGDSAAGPFTAIASNLTAPGYTDAGLTNGHQYFYEVQGVVQLGTVTTAPISATPSLQPPIQVTGVTTVPAPTKVTVSWTATPFTDSYDVLRGPVGGPFAPIKTGVIGTSYIDNTVVIGNIYAYEVIAKNGVGSGPASAPATADLVHGAIIRYYNNQWWKSPQNNTTGYIQPSLTGVDADTIVSQVNQIYGTNASPIAGIQNVNWSDVIAGKIVIPASAITNIDGVTQDPIVFSSNTDDDGYLFIDGQLVASDPGGHGQRDAYLGGTGGTQVPLVLTPGPHNFQLFHSEGGGGAGAIMKWITHFGTPQQSGLTIIPAGIYLTQTGVPVAATGLTATGAPGTGAILQWTDNATNELNYVVQRSTTPNFAAGTVLNVATLPINDNASPTMNFTEAGNSGLQTTYYRIVSTNFDGTSAPSNVVKVDPFSAVQPGAEAHFYNNQWWGSSNQSTTAPVSQGAAPTADVHTILSTIDGAGVDPTGPTTGIRGANFSVVFTGQIVISPTGAGSYTFPEQSDDDSYLYVDGVLVASDPGGHGVRIAPNLTPITLAAGPHNFQYFLSQGGGGWDFHLHYIGPDSGGVDTIVPSQPFGSPTAAGMTTLSDALVAPGAIAFTNVSSGSVTINWGDTNKDELQYVLERSTDSFATIVTPLTTTGINGTTFTDTTVLPNTLYQYRVHAVNFDSFSSFTTNFITTSVIGTGGSIVATQRPTSSYVNLTALGTRDWAHWGYDGAGAFNHKASATEHISDVSAVNGASKTQFTTSPVGFSWSDGTPNVAISNSETSIYTLGAGKGFEFTSPADTTPRRLQIYVGVLNATGQLTAHLSDGSSVPLSGTTLDATGATAVTGVYTIDYKAGSANQFLIVDWTETVDHGTGAIALGGAVLGNTTDFIASANTAINQVTLSWVAPPAATGFNVLRGPVGGPFATIATGVTGAGYTDNTALLGNVYSYEVVVQGGGPTSAPVTADLLNGVSVRYYNDQWWRSAQGNTTGNVQASLTNVNSTAIYTQANQIYGVNASPVVGIQNVNWSDVITGKIVIAASDVTNVDGVTQDPIVFASSSDDDGYLYIDGQLVTSDPGGHGQRDSYLGGDGTNPGTNQVPLVLIPGPHDFQFFHSEGGGGAGAILKWITHFGTAQAAAAPVVIPTGKFLTQSGTPAAPTAFTAVGANGTGVIMSWTDNAKNEINYIIQRSTTPNFALGTVQTVPSPLNDNKVSTTVNFTDAGNLGTQTTYYRVVAANFDGTSTASNSIKVDPFGTAFAGAEGHFYNNTWWKSDDQSTNATATKGASVVADVNIILSDITGVGNQNAGPTTGVRAEQFSIAATGKLIITTAGTYTFPTQSDDDSYLYVDGVLVASDPKPHGREVAPNQSPIALSAGSHDFQFFVSQQGGGWIYELWYNGPDSGGSAALVPSAALTALSSTVVAPGALTFSNVTGNSVKLNWGDTNISEIQYVIERSTDNFVADDTVVGTSGINATSFTDTNVPVGTFTYRVHAVNFDSVGGFATATLDHVPPTVTNANFKFSSHPPAMDLAFSENVSASLTGTTIGVANLTAGGSVNYVKTYNAVNNTATLTFLSELPDGNYRVSVPTTVTDATGNGLATTFTSDFFVLKGDVDRDRSVGFTDLVAVAQHYGQSGATYATGDLDGDGTVGFPDLVAIAQNYGKTLAPPAGAAVPSGSVASPAEQAAVIAALPAGPAKTFATQLLGLGAKPVAKPVVPVSKPVVKTVAKPAIKAANKPSAVASATFSTTRIATAVKKKNDLFN